MTLKELRIEQIHQLFEQEAANAILVGEVLGRWDSQEEIEYKIMAQITPPITTVG